MSAYEVDSTIKYIAFDVEEVGLTGSNAYVDEHVGEDIRAMFSLDMIAWDDGSYQMDIRAPELATELVNDLIAAIGEYGGPLNYDVIWGPASSDNRPFATAGYQAALLIEHDYSANPCWHQPCDTVDNPGYLSLELALDIVRSVAGWLGDQAGAHVPFDCDADGNADAAQIAADASLDCNGNGILDACEYLGTQDLDGSGCPRRGARFWPEWRATATAIGSRTSFRPPSIRTAMATVFPTCVISRAWRIRMSI